MKKRRTRGSQAGVALLMVITTVAILGIVVVEFSSTARTHLNQGVNLRDQARASTLADTSMVMARACLDHAAWGPFGQMQSKLDMEKLCNMLLGIFVRGRIDLPIGGLSVELDGIQGVGIAQGEIEDIKLIPEEGRIGLAGLHCGARNGNAGAAPGAPTHCSSQLATVNQLRAVLCDPAIAQVFETERSDGQRYTREEVIANLIDWVDPDDTRTAFDVTGNLIDSTGEGEDSYYARQDDRYKVKDEPFDSIEELRLVRGVDDELYDFLKDKVSVHSAGKVNVNSASAEVLAAHLRAASVAGLVAETAFCGKEVENAGGGLDTADRFFQLAAQLIVEARQYRQLRADGNRLFSRPFKNAKDFTQCAQNPLNCWYQELNGSFMAFRVAGMNDQQAKMARLQQAGFGGDEAVFLQWMANAQMRWDDVERRSRTDSELFRLEAAGRVGNMTRKVFAILKREPQYVRTLYYRED
jgi:hypothetical protein